MTRIGVFILLLTISATRSSKINRQPKFNAESKNYNNTEVIIDYRLPNNTKPNSYDIQITTQIDKNIFDFNGTVIINLTIVENRTRLIVLHKRKIEIQSVKLSNSTDEIDLIQEYDEDTEFLKLSPSDNQTYFLKDQLYNLTINYNGVLREDNAGFYRSSFTNSNNKTIFLAATQFESVEARHGFPCYDEPAFKANFTISIQHGPTYKAISNMPIDDDKTIKGLTIFKISPKMSTYLVAFVVFDFNSTSARFHEITQRIFSRSEKQNDVDFALISALQITNSLSDYFGVAFSLPKLDLVAIPDYGYGPMENWGLIVYPEKDILYNKHKSTVYTQTNIANNIAHEHTHQWIGNLVTPEWWTFLWLKEGFATMFSYIIEDLVFPEWDIMQNFQIDVYQKSLDFDAHDFPRPMTHYVQTPSEILEIYDYVSYLKGASVLIMWQNVLTDIVFQQGLNKYLKNKAYSTSNEDDLFSALAIAAKENNMPISTILNEMMKSWTNQGGYPLLHVERNYTDGSFVILQQPFYKSYQLTTDQLWYIPYNYATGKYSDFRNTTPNGYLKKEKQTQVNANLDNGEWLILNKRSTGYYRVNYDYKNWELIIDILKANHLIIHPHNRASLLFDAHELMKMDLLSHEILLNMLQYLKNEEDYAPWATAEKILTELYTYLQNDRYYSYAYKSFLRSLVSDIYEKLGIHEIPGEHRLRTYTRPIAINLACLANNSHCLANTKEKLNQFVTQGVKIEPNLQESIYCYGLVQASDQIFDFMYTLLMNSEDEAQRKLLISALGCAQSITQLKKFIESSISNDGNVTLQIDERTTILSSVYSRSEVGFFISIDFLMENFNEYANLGSEFEEINPVDIDLREMSSYVVNRLQERKLYQLVKKIKAHRNQTTVFEEEIDSFLQHSYNWVQQNRRPITVWLKQFKSGSSNFAAPLILIFASVIFVNQIIY